MKLRIFVLTVILAGAMVLVTTKSHLLPQALTRPISSGNLWSQPVAAKTSALSAEEQNNIDVYKGSRGAVVNITSTVYQQDFFFRVLQSREIGSGFFVTNDGLILTNAHVVSGSQQQPQVTADDGTTYKGTVLARDLANDLALVKITPKKPIAALRLGDSEPLQVGQKVLAIGNPFGLQQSLTTGIVSSLGRTIQDENERKLEGMIQTDAAINPGNSGGPLLDSSGNVIGINTAIYGQGGNIGIGFAMPINRAKSMMTDFKNGRSFKRPRLGVSVFFVTGDYAELLNLPSQGGLLVQEVVPGSAAQLAGIRPGKREVIVGMYKMAIGGDLILALDGRAADREDAISQAVSKKHPGDTIVLTIWRDGKQIKVPVKLGESPDEQLL